MTSHAEVETSKAITRQAITTALKNNGFWLVVVHNRFDDRLKDGLVSDIVDTITQREIDSVVLALANTNIAKLASPREVLAILVKRAGHDTVGSVEGLLNAITVMNIDVNVKNSLLEAQELDDAENNVYRKLAWVSKWIVELTVDVTEATCFTLLRVMKTASPIDSDVAFATVESSSALHTTTSTDSTEFEQPIEDWAIITNIVFALFLRKCVHVIRSDLLEKIYVLVGVELGHFVTGRRFRTLCRESVRAYWSYRGLKIARKKQIMEPKVRGKLPPRPRIK